MRAAAMLFLAIGLSSPKLWASGPVAKFNIPAGDAAQTLHEFYMQSQVQILYLASTVAGVKTHPVNGEFEASDALALMLKGTRLDFQFENERSALVVPQATAGAAMSVKRADSKRHGFSTPEGLLGEGPDIGEITVTGTLIRGVLDLTLPLQVIGANDVKTSAYATVQDVLRTLPVSGGALYGEDFGGGNNFTYGTALSLRGLPSGATLVLVNGRRQPGAGLDGDFVDVSNIPWTMVKRIEVLPDGTSALYGSDAVAGVINIVLKNELDGAETQARFGLAADGAAESVAAQMFGGRWSTGKWLFGYQFSERTPLMARDRSYAANTDKRSFGGRDFRSFRSVPGNILDPTTLQPVYALPPGQDGSSLDADDLAAGAFNYRNTFSDYSLLPYKTIHSALLNLSQKIGDRVELFAEGRITQRDMRRQGGNGNDGDLLFVPASNPFFVDPFGNSPFVIVAYSFVKDLGLPVFASRTDNAVGTAGVKTAFAGDWSATVASSYGRERMRYAAFNQVDMGAAAIRSALADPNPATAFNPFGDGSFVNNPQTLESIRYTQRILAASDIGSVSAVADGSLFASKGGLVKAAVGAEIRRERLFRELRGRPQSYERSIDAAFSELLIPLAGDPRDSRAVPRLELTLAGRYEKYDDFGTTFNPKAGLRWIPIDSLKLRGSWGTSFKAPTFIDLHDTSQNVAGSFLFPDPKSQTGRSTVLARQGNNPDLDEATAETWTAGFDLTPPALPGIAISVTGYEIRYNNQIVQPGLTSPFDILGQEDRWAQVITRNPTQAQIDAFCEGPDLMIPVAQCKATVPAAIIDFRKRNLSSTVVRGVDLTLDHSLRNRFGQFGFSLEASYLFDFEQALTDTAPSVSVLDTAQNPLSTRLRGTLDWSRNGKNQPGFAAYMAVNHEGSYRNPGSPLVSSVRPWRTLDLRLSYRTARGAGWWNNLECALNGSNVLDKDPPFVDQLWGYDYINAEPVGRVTSFYVQKNW